MYRFLILAEKVFYVPEPDKGVALLAGVGLLGWLVVRRRA